MTQWRDARFQKALEAAPDADARPQAAIAESIRAAARSSLATASAQCDVDVPWWQRLWAQTGKPHAPWGAALATVLLGVLVTTLWWDAPVPDAQPVASAPAVEDKPVATEAATRADSARESPQVAGQAEKSPTSLPVPVPAPAPPTALAKTPVSRTEPVAVAALPVAAAPAPAPTPASASANAKTAESLAAPVATADAANAPRSADAPVAAEATRRSAPAAVAVAPAPTVAAVGPVPTSTVAAAATAAGAPAPAAKRATPAHVNTLDVEVDGRTATADATQAQLLYAHLQGLEQQLIWGAAPPAADAGEAPTLQLRLRAQGSLVATFTLRGRQARWQREGHSALGATLDDQQRDQLMRLARAALAADSTTRSTP